MLSGITNLLFGTVEEQKEDNVAIDLKTTPTENNEWVLVDKENIADDTVTQAAPQSSDVPLIPPILSKSSPPTKHKCPSPYCLVDEETWLVTPPSCFTSEFRSTPDESPLENLLIEHPSMSVYGPQNRSSSDGAEADDTSSSDSERQQIRSVHHPPRTPSAVAARAGLIAHINNIKPMQKAQNKKYAKKLGKNQLARCNRVQHYQKSSRHHRHQYKFIRQPATHNACY